MQFSFDNSYTRLPERFYRAAMPAAARAPQLIRFNMALAEELNLNFAGVGDEALAAMEARAAAVAAGMQAARNRAAELAR